MSKYHNSKPTDSRHGEIILVLPSPSLLLLSSCYSNILLLNCSLKYEINLLIVVNRLEAKAAQQMQAFSIKPLRENCRESKRNATFSKKSHGNAYCTG